MTRRYYRPIKDEIIVSTLHYLRQHIGREALPGMEHVEALLEQWEMRAANLLKAELKRKGVTYAQLAEMIGDKEVNIRNKLSRGKFSASFMLHALEAIGADSVRL